MFRSIGVKTTRLCAVFLLLVLSACSEDQTQKPVEIESEVQMSETTAVEKAKQATAETVDKAKAKVGEAREAVEKAVDDAVTQGAEVVENSKKVLKQVSTDTKEGISNTASKVAEKTQATLTPAMDKANNLLSTSAQKANEISASLQGKEKPLADLANDPITTVSKKATSTVLPETIVLENNFGSVTLTHRYHAETYGCAICHGDNTPGPIELTKELAHSSMCKDCHKSAGGPTGCTECHIK